MTEKGTEQPRPVTPEKSRETTRLEILGSGGRAREAQSEGLSKMREAIIAAEARGDHLTADRIRKNLEKVEKTLGL